jgi:hypothetical protein
MVVFAAALTATRPTARDSAPDNPVLVSTMTPLADGGTFSFPDGITLTVAPGWTIEAVHKATPDELSMIASML